MSKTKTKAAAILSQPADCRRLGLFGCNHAILKGTDTWGNLLLDHNTIEEFSADLHKAMAEEMPDGLDGIQFEVDVTKGKIVFQRLGEFCQMD